MMTFEAESMRRSYLDVVKTIRWNGERVDTRLGPSMEASPALITGCDPLDVLPVRTGRGVVKALACVEALSLIAEEADPRLFVAAAPHYADYVDPETNQLEVAYGPRIESQMAWATHRLTRDPDSRQAHVDLWSPVMDRPGLRAYPCVVSCGFLVRGGALDLFVEMRSNDAWLGLPYDMFAFAQLQATLAAVLGRPLGRYHHYSRSLHLYEKHWEKADGLTYDPTADWAPTFQGVSGDSWHEARYRAQALLRGEPLRGGMSMSEVAYEAVMAGVLEKVAG
jgi:thymidylate synthase